MSLAALAQFAINNGGSQRKNNVPVWELPVVDARSAINIRDANKIVQEDGSQKLALILGRKRMSLDAIAPKATHINAPFDKIDEFTDILQQAIDSGAFDTAIVEAQAELKEAAEMREMEEEEAAKKALEAATAEGETVADTTQAEAESNGLDLTELD